MNPRIPDLLRALGLLTLLPLLVALAACGGGDDDGPVDTCRAHCEHVGAATNCPPEVAGQEVTDCQASCEPFLASLSAECRDAVVATYVCSMAEYTYECDDGGDTPFAVWEGEDDPCADEFDTWAACLTDR
jgi:hypothetical protein